MNIQHKRLCKFNGLRKSVRENRINRERNRIKMQRACFINAARLVSNGETIKVKAL